MVMIFVFDLSLVHGLRGASLISLKGCLGTGGFVSV